MRYSLEKGFEQNDTSLPGKIFPEKNGIEQVESAEKSEGLLDKKRAEKILEDHAGNYSAIKNALRKENLYPYRAEWLHEDPFDEKALSEVKEAGILSPEVEEMLFILRLFDPETFKHSLRTFLIGKTKFESDGTVGRMLREKITSELNGHDAQKIFYRALLLHDIGKIAIPHFVTKNTLRDQDWINKGEAHCTHDDMNCFLRQIQEKHLRPKDIIPIRYGLSEEEILSLKERGFDPDLPLGEIMKSHAEKSSEILRDAGFQIEAMIVKDHHADDFSDKEAFPSAETSVKISKALARAVHIADFLDAIKNARSYKGSHDLFETLAFLVEEVTHGKLPDQELVRYWIIDEIESLKKDAEGGQQHPVKEYMLRMEKSHRKKEIESFRKVAAFYDRRSKNRSIK